MTEGLTPGEGLGIDRPNEGAAEKLTLREADGANSSGELIVVNGVEEDKIIIEPQDDERKRLIDDERERLLKIVYGIAEKFKGTREYDFYDLLWQELPEEVPGSESLFGLKVVLVEDLPNIQLLLLPHFTVATGGNFSTVHCFGQGLEAVVEEILTHDPDVVLMDYDLSGFTPGIFPATGVEVIGGLRETSYTGLIIGFSSDKRYGDKLLNAGADASVPKGDNIVKAECVPEVAATVSLLMEDKTLE